MDDDICYKPKYYAGKWYVHCVVTGWMGPNFDTQRDALNACNEKNKAPKRGPTEKDEGMEKYVFRS